MEGVGIILARGGSKGLPKKNIYPLLGEPLINHTLRFLLRHSFITQVVVATDCDDIEKACLDFDRQRTLILRRPENVSNDSATTKDALRWVYQQISEMNVLADFFVYMQVTEPLRPNDILVRCVDVFESQSAPSVFAAYEMHKNFWTYDSANQRFHRLTEFSTAEMPRQIKPSILREDSGVCCVMSRALFAEGTRVCDGSAAVPYDHPGALIDIHSVSDIRIAEKIILADMENSCCD